ncbi:hypothetical protein FACS189459_3350 [Bacilli bacterium]|nr:hypothetical protein FACS189459_3350 [Bacilli bacterium]
MPIINIENDIEGSTAFNRKKSRLTITHSGIITSVNAIAKE